MDVGALYKPNVFQSRYFLITIYRILKIKIFSCSCWASVENGLLWRRASRWSLLYSGFRYTIATIQNLAVYLLGVRVSIFPTLVPRLSSLWKLWYILMKYIFSI